jgi:hypothetical protein
MLRAIQLLPWGLNFAPGRQRSLPKVQFLIALTNQLQNRRCGIWCKAEMSHYPQLFSDNARVAFPLSEPSADGKRGMPVLDFLTILYEDDHDLLRRLIRNQNIRLPLKGD